MHVLKIFTLVLISTISIILIGCSTTNDFSDIELRLVSDKVTININEEIKITDLYITNAELNVNVVIEDIFVAKFSDGKIYAESVGSTIVQLTFHNKEKEYSKTYELELCVKGKEYFYATSLEVVDYLKLNVGDRVLVNDYYTIYPETSDVVASIHIADNKLVIDNRDYITAVSAGKSYITIKVQIGVDRFITKTIVVEIISIVQNIDLVVEVLDENNVEPEYITNNKSYYIYIKDTSCLDINNFVLSDNIIVNDSYVNGSDIIFNVYFLELGDYVILYNDERYSGKSVITNNFDYYYLEKFEAKLFSERILNFYNDSYCFTLTKNTESPYAYMAKVELLYDKNKLDNYDISLGDNDCFEIVNKEIYSNVVGNNTVIIKFLDFTFELKVFAEKAFAKSIEISYPYKIYLSDIDNVSIDIIPDYEYNYLPDDLHIELESGTGLSVDGNNIKINSYVTNIVGKVISSCGICESFEIDVYKYKITDVSIFCNNVIIGDELIIRESVILDIVFYSGKDIVNIDNEMNFRYVVEGDNCIKITQEYVEKYLFVFISSEGSCVLKIIDGHGNLLRELIIVVENITI